MRNKACLVIAFAFLWLSFAFASQLEFRATDYLPLGVGYTWHYLDSSAMGIDTVINTIIDDTTIPGGPAYVIVSTSADTAETSLVQIRSDGIYNLTFVGAMKILPATFRIGDSWAMFSLDSSWDSAGFTYHIQMDVESRAETLEDVTVPAGSFSDCIKVISDGEIHLQVLSGGVPFYDTTFRGNLREVWYARHIGVVRSIDHDITGMVPDHYGSLLSHSFAEVSESPAKPINNDLIVAPNPFNSACFIRVPEGAKIEIFDVTGKLIESLKSENGSAVWRPKDGVGSGVYIISTDVDGKAKTSARVIFIK